MHLFSSVIVLPAVAVVLCVLVMSTGGACSFRDDMQSITVFAASSLQEPLKHITGEYQDQTKVKVYVSLGGSLSLANQITRGAPAEVFISAGTVPTDILLVDGVVEPRDVNPWLTNELLLVTGKPNRFKDKGIEVVLENTVAIADPALAPAGRYAQQCISSFGMWDQIEYSVIRSPNARAALASVETGSADMAFIYRTDLHLSSAVEKILQCPEESHSPIEYLVSLVSDDSQPEHSVGFIDFLDSEYSKAIMEKYGFTVIKQSK